ncbi:MAG: ABC transporter substrate-binding protein [Actinomycetota bacterium]|nr:ABC transporter substrate-binding protein [Actinomycetota bacterium]
MTPPNPLSAAPGLSRRHFLSYAAAAGSAAALGGCGGSGDEPKASPGGSASRTAGTEKIRLALWSQPITEQAHLFAAQDRGWFADEGLEVELIGGAGGGDAIKNILAGNADIAFANLEPMMFAMLQGAKLRGIYNVYPNNVFNVISPVGKQITEPKDLKGRKVGVYSQASGTRYNLLVMLRSAGLSERDVQVIATGLPPNFGPLKAGQVDAQAATDTGLYAARKAGIGEVNVIEAKEYLNSPSDALIVTQQVFDEREETLRKFISVYRRAAQWMLDNPQKAAEVAVTRATDGKDAARNRDIIDLRNASTVDPGTDENGLGWFDTEVLADMEQTFLDLKLIPKKVGFADAFTNELLPDA